MSKCGQWAGYGLRHLTESEFNMVAEEPMMKKWLAEAAIPLEALCGSIREAPLGEIDPELQKELLESCESIRDLLGLKREKVFGRPQSCT